MRSGEGGSCFVSVLSFRRCVHSRTISFSFPSVQRERAIASCLLPRIVTNQRHCASFAPCQIEGRTFITYILSFHSCQSLTFVVQKRVYVRVSVFRSVSVLYCMVFFFEILQMDKTIGFLFFALCDSCCVVECRVGVLGLECGKGLLVIGRMSWFLLPPPRHIHTSTYIYTPPYRYAVCCNG